MLEPLAVLLFCAALLAFLEALYSLKGGLDLLRLTRAVRQGSPDGEFPPATLIIPCRGLDPGLKENLAAYFRQDHPGYQLLFVTQPQDPSVAVIRGLMEKFSETRSTLLLAGEARGRSQKVHNLLEAMGGLRPQDEVIAFGDSDIRPHIGWLRDLVAPLRNSEVGVTTGFRWYVPQTSSCGSLLRSVWNAGTLTLLKRRGSPFAWGGAMAIRRVDFEAWEVRRYWRGALSDDYALSSAARDHGGPICFQPRCLSLSFEDCSLGELLNWSFRQLAITRIYQPRLWQVGFVSQLLNFLALWAGTLLLLVGWAFGTGVTVSAHLLIALSLLIIGIYGLGCLKGYVRLRAVRKLLEEEETIIRSWWAYVFLTPLASLITLLGLLRSLTTREIQWRGLRYRMISPSQTESL